MLTKEELYAGIEEKLKKVVKESTLIKDDFYRGFELGKLYEWVGIFYQHAIISTNEYLELTETIDKIVESKKEGVDYELPSIK